MKVLKISWLTFNICSSLPSPSNLLMDKKQPLPCKLRKFSISTDWNRTRCPSEITRKWCLVTFQIPHRTPWQLGYAWCATTCLTEECWSWNIVNGTVNDYPPWNSKILQKKPPNLLGNHPIWRWYFSHGLVETTNEYTKPACLGLTSSIPSLAFPSDFRGTSLAKHTCPTLSTSWGPSPPGVL